MKQSSEIAFFDRYTQGIAHEKVYGGKAIEFVYKNQFGNLFLPLLV